MSFASFSQGLQSSYGYLGGAISAYPGFNSYTAPVYSYGYPAAADTPYSQLPAYSYNGLQLSQPAYSSGFQLSQPAIESPYVSSATFGAPAFGLPVASYANVAAYSPLQGYQPNSYAVPAPVMAAPALPALPAPVPHSFGFDLSATIAPIQAASFSNPLFVPQPASFSNPLFAPQPASFSNPLFAPQSISFSNPLFAPQAGSFSNPLFAAPGASLSNPLFAPPGGSLSNPLFPSAPAETPRSQPPVVHALPTTQYRQPSVAQGSRVSNPLGDTRSSANPQYQVTTPRNGHY